MCLRLAEVRNRGAVTRTVRGVRSAATRANHARRAVVLQGRASSHHRERCTAVVGGRVRRRDPTTSRKRRRKAQAKRGRHENIYTACGRTYSRLAHSGHTTATIYDYQGKRHVNMSGDVKTGGVAVYDYEQRCHITGSGGSLYHHSNRAHITLQLNGASLQATMATDAAPGGSRQRRSVRMTAAKSATATRRHCSGSLGKFTSTQAGRVSGRRRA